MHTWIEPLISRPSTQEGKEISRCPPLKPEFGGFPPRPQFLIDEAMSWFEKERDSPNLIPVQGIGSVSVRLVAGQDESEVEYSAPWTENPSTWTTGTQIKFFDQAAGIVGRELRDMRAVIDAAPLDMLPPIHDKYHGQQQQQQLTREEQLVAFQQYQETSAYYVDNGAAHFASHAATHVPKDVLSGAGFSKQILRLADPRSRVFQYPSPSEALTTMAKRPHARLNAPSSSVVMVGSKPPAVDDTWYTLNKMKRQWLHQYNRSDEEMHEPKPPRSKPMKRTRDVEEAAPQDISFSLNIVGGTRPCTGSRPNTGSGPNTTSRPNTGSRSVSKAASASSPWVTSPVPEDAVPTSPSGFSLRTPASRPASKPVHGYGSTYGTTEHSWNDESLLETEESSGHDMSQRPDDHLRVHATGHETHSSYDSAIRLDAHGLPMRHATTFQKLLQPEADPLPRAGLSPIGEVSFSSMGDDSMGSPPRSPELRLGLSMEAHAGMRLAGQKPRTPEGSPLASFEEVSANKSWADHYQRDGNQLGFDWRREDAGPTAASPGSPHRGSSPVPPHKGASPPSQSPPSKGFVGMQVQGSRSQIALQTSQIYLQSTVAMGTGRRDVEGLKRRRTEVRTQQGKDEDRFEHIEQKSPRERQSITIHSPENNKRRLVMDELQRKQIVANGNRALLRCQEDINHKMLKRAMSYHNLATKLFTNAEALHEKRAHLDDLHHRILYMTREYQDFLFHAERTETQSPPPSPTVPTVRAILRGPDRLQPDGMNATTRDELEEMRRRALQEERIRREHLIEEAKHTAGLAAQLKRLEDMEALTAVEMGELAAEAKVEEGPEKESAATAAEASAATEETAEAAAKRQREREWRKRILAEERRYLGEMDRRLAEEERIILERQKQEKEKEEEERRIFEAAAVEEKRKANETEAKRKKREVETKKKAEEERRRKDLEEAGRRRAMEETRAAQEVAEWLNNVIAELLAGEVARLIAEEARCIAKEARENAANIRQLAIPKSMPAGLYEPADASSQRTQLLSTSRRVSQLGQSAHKLQCRLEAKSTSKYALKFKSAIEAVMDANKAYSEAADALYDEQIRQCIQQLIHDVEVKDAQEKAEREAAELAEAVASITEEAAEKWLDSKMHQVVAELAVYCARSARVEVQEEIIAERKRREEERKRKEEEERLAKRAAAGVLAPFARRAICSAQYSVTLLEIFAEEERLRQEAERKRREEELKMAKQRAAETLQAIIRRRSLNHAFVEVLVAAIVLEARCRCIVSRTEYADSVDAVISLQATAKQTVARTTYIACFQAVCTVQGVIRTRAIHAAHAIRRTPACCLQARLRSCLQRKLHSMRLLSQALLGPYIRQQRARHDYSLYFFECPILVAAFKRMAVQSELHIPTMRSCASILQTHIRRKFASQSLQHKLAVMALEPYVKRILASSAWNTCISAAVKVLWTTKSALVAAGYLQSRQAVELLQRAVRRTMDVAAYQVEALEVRRVEEEERKRQEAEEQARRREEEVSRKQKEIMEQMEAKSKADKEAREAEKAKEAERKKMLAEYSHKKIEETEIKRPATPVKLRHAGKDDHETFALTVGYERQKMYPDAIIALTSIIDKMEMNDLRMACLCKRATCFGKLGMRKDCFKDLQRAMKDFPDDYMPYYMRALHHVLWKSDDLAMRDILSVFKLKPDHAESLNLQANLAFKNTFYVDAIQLTTRALSIKQDIPQLYIIRGLSREKLGSMQQASDDLEKAIEMMLQNMPRSDTQVDEEDLSSLSSTLTDEVFVVFCDTCLADAHNGAQRAVDVLTKMIDFTSKRAVVFALRARAYCAMNQFSKAEEDFERAEKAEENNAHVLLLHATFLRNGDPASAIAECIQATEMDPENARAHFVLGKLHEQYQSSREALDAYKKVLECNRNYASEMILYEAALRAGALQFKLDQSPAPSSYMLFCEDKRLERKEAGYEEPLDVKKLGTMWEALNDEAREPWAKKAEQIKNSSSLKERAVELFLEAARLNPTAIDPFLTLAKYLQASGLYRLAIKQLNRLIHMQPQDPRNYLLRAQCLLLMGDKAGATRDRQIALQLDTRNDPDVIEMKIEYLVSKEDYEKALVMVHDAIAAHPQHHHFKTVEAQLYFYTGDLDTARTKFNQCVRTGTADSETYRARAEFFQHTGEYGAAVNEYGQALELDSENPSTYVGRGEALLMTKRSDKAVEDLDKALTLYGHGDKRALLVRARALELNGDTAGALRDYALILELLDTEQTKVPTTVKGLFANNSKDERQFYFFEAHMKSGLLCTKRRDFAGAIKHYNHVLKVKPQCVQALLHRGIAYHSHGYHESGQQDYTRALAAESGHAIVLQNRAKAFASQRNWKRAIHDMEGIPEADRDAAVWQLLATCYFQNEQREAALKAINAALQLDNLSLTALVDLEPPRLTARHLSPTPHTCLVTLSLPVPSLAVHSSECTY